MFLGKFFIFVRSFAFLCFCSTAFLCFLCFWCFWCFLVLSVLFVRAKSFCKKNKKFKTSLILLLNSSYYKHEFFNHFNLFQSLLQSFLIITVFFNYNNLFQLLQFFSIIKIFLIITIFFNHYNLFQLSQLFLIIMTSFKYHDLLYYNLFYGNLF